MNNKYALMGFILDEGKNTTRFQWVLDTTMCSSSNTRISVIVIKDRLRLSLGEISSSIFLCVLGILKVLGHHNYFEHLDIFRTSDDHIDSDSLGNRW